MQKIGLIGGMSWESTATYYQLINAGVKEALGGFHSAKIILESVDFAEIEAQQRRGDWDASAKTLSDAAKNLEQAGAEVLLICTNTMHKIADEVAAAVSIPLLHIADATAALLKAEGHSKVGLLGTKFTMEQDFYKGRLSEKFGLEVVIPDQTDMETVHTIIYNELCLGQIHDASRQQYLAIMDRLKDKGAEAIILGCTEIALLIRPTDTDIPIIDTTSVHATAAVKAAITGNGAVEF